MYDKEKVDLVGLIFTYCFFCTNFSFSNLFEKLTHYYNYFIKTNVHLGIHTNNVNLSIEIKALIKTGTCMVSCMSSHITMCAPYSYEFLYLLPRGYANFIIMLIVLKK